MSIVIACSHGTRFAEGRAEIARVREALAAALPGDTVLEAFVDVEQPEVADVVARAVATARESAPASEDDTARSAEVIVVPLLLSTGFHTGVDIAGSVEPWPEAVAAAPIGPHPRLVLALRDRIADLPGNDAGHRPGDHVVLAAAGSSDPAAAVAVRQMRDLLARWLPCPVTIGYGAGAAPSIPDAVDCARSSGARRVIAVSYVLAPGHFANLVTAAGADLTTAPLGAHPAVVDVLVERRRAAASITPGPLAAV